MKNIYYGVLTGAIAFYLIVLYSTEKLSYYIHPRYNLMTLIIAAFTVLVVVASFIYEARHSPKMLGSAAIIVLAGAFLPRPFFIAIFIFALFIGSFALIKKKAISFEDSKKSLFLIVTLAVIYLFIPKPLSSSTANQRATDFNTLNRADSASGVLLTGFNVNTKAYSLGDWVASINSNPDIESYVGKEVAVSGFVLNANAEKEDTFIVARFVLTCCAVDARPVGLYVESDSKQIENDDWVEVTGRFKIIEIDGKKTLIIAPDELKKIETPRNPYLY